MLAANRVKQGVGSDTGPLLSVCDQRAQRPRLRIHKRAAGSWYISAVLIGTLSVRHARGTWTAALGLKRIYSSDEPRVDTLDDVL